MVHTSALVDVDDVNILGRSIHTVKKNTQVLPVTSEEIVLEVNAETRSKLESRTTLQLQDI